jgi:hypothetical protein
LLTKTATKKKQKRLLTVSGLTGINAAHLFGKDRKIDRQGSEKKQQAVKKKIDREFDFRYSLSPVATATEKQNRVFEN